MKEYKSLLQLLKAFPDEKTCIEHLEKLRWPKGVICPLCGSSRKFHRITRGYLYKCSDCGKSFSVRKNTIFEDSPLSLRTWFAAFWLITSNRKGINSCQLSREIGVTQKTAWFILGRLREVASIMGSTGGTASGIVEVDETYVGGKEKNKHYNKKIKSGRGTVGKQAIVGAHERSGKVKAAPVQNTSQEDLHKFVKENISPGSMLYTDEHSGYDNLENYQREYVTHSSGEYVRGDIHTNGIESFWSLFKRGYYGVFHHFSNKHIHRYIAEFEMRWNMSIFAQTLRFDSMLESISGTRLTYSQLIK